MSEKNNNQTYEETAGKETYEQNGVEINFGRSGGNRVHINIGRAKSKVIRKLSALLPLLCTTIFFVLGFCFNLIPIIASISFLKSTERGFCTDEWSIILQSLLSNFSCFFSTIWAFLINNFALILESCVWVKLFYNSRWL